MLRRNRERKATYRCHRVGLENLLVETSITLYQFFELKRDLVPDNPKTYSLRRELQR